MSNPPIHLTKPSQNPRKTVKTENFWSTLTKMEKKFTLLHTVATAGVFSAVSFWYGFMFGRESARKELGNIIDDLRRSNSDSTPPPSHS